MPIPTTAEPPTTTAVSAPAVTAATDDADPTIASLLSTLLNSIDALAIATTRLNTQIQQHCSPSSLDTTALKADDGEKSPGSGVGIGLFQLPLLRQQEQKNGLGNERNGQQVRGGRGAAMVVEELKMRRDEVVAVHRRLEDKVNGMGDGGGGAEGGEGSDQSITANPASTTSQPPPISDLIKERDTLLKQAQQKSRQIKRFLESSYNLQYLIREVVGEEEFAAMEEGGSGSESVAKP
ncbi:hypothetical protein HK102_009210 [Quaeritorhiza haematococci]|nr:hypothetical protein HK102_009210 [Quaeritorhiza haematococci]